MTTLPVRDALPRYLAPLPAWLEDLSLRFAWPIVIVNLLGTLFGLWFYGIRPFSSPIVQGQLATEPLVLWPLIPQSPTATLFIAVSLGLWKLGRSREWINALAFFGCIKLGLWTPFVLLVFREEFAYVHPAMYQFLLWSHLAMVAEAFLIHRFSDFPPRAIVIAVVWYAVSDLVSYFVPIIGDPHHPALPIARDALVWGGATALQLAAAAAVLLTLLATILAFLTYIEKHNRRARHG